MEARPEANKAMIAAYREADKVNLPMFKQKLDRDHATPTRTSRSSRRSPASRSGTNGWPTTRSKFDSKGVLDAMLKEIEQRPRPSTHRHDDAGGNRRPTARRAPCAGPAGLFPRASGIRPDPRAGEAAWLTQKPAIRHSAQGGGALGAVDRFVFRIEKLTALISGLGIFALMLVGVVHVLGRKFFDMPIFGYIDIVEIMMAFMVFLAIAYTERLGGHIRMELFVGMLKGRWLALFELVGVVLGLVIVAVLLVYSWDHAMRALLPRRLHHRRADPTVAVEDHRADLARRCCSCACS